MKVQNEIAKSRASYADQWEYTSKFYSIQGYYTTIDHGHSDR